MNFNITKRGKKESMAWVRERTIPTERALGRKSSGFGLETENTAVGIRHANYATPLSRQRLALTSSTSGGHSVGIVRSRTQATEFIFFLLV
jgi:hypothetical protein